MPKQPKCRVCKKDVQTFASIRYTDLTGWCSTECYEKESKEERDRYQAEKSQREIQTYGRVLDEDGS